MKSGTEFKHNLMVVDQRKPFFITAITFWALPCSVKHAFFSELIFADLLNLICWCVFMFYVIKWERIMMKASVSPFWKEDELDYWLVCILFFRVRKKTIYVSSPTSVDKFRQLIIPDIDHEWYVIEWWSRDLYLTWSDDQECVCKKKGDILSTS